eukprot:COSAG05_NODE_1129_length_5779_cov_11.914789_3_plen_52_part_00
MVEALYGAASLKGKRAVVEALAAHEPTLKLDFHGRTTSFSLSLALVSLSHS